MTQLPMIIVLIGLTLYVVLGGADFGAAVWQVFAGRGELAERVRHRAHESMSPVWEANHVWLIFVLTVLWTAYPEAFGSIASTLWVPLGLAGIGIIVRGAAYALRSATADPVQVQQIDRASALASVLAPFSLGAALGAIAARRVPVGNARGDQWTSWTGSVSIVVGLLAVVTAAYLAAVFLAGDADRRGEDDVAQAFRRRALGSAVVAGALAIVGLFVVRHDVRALWDPLTTGDGLPGVIVSILAGLMTGVHLLRGQFERARYTSALAVAGIVGGWALAQNPTILPGLTIDQAVAPGSTLIALLVAIGAGGALLFPSLVLLFRLALGGQLEHTDHEPDTVGPGAVLSAAREGLLVRAAGACLLVGVGLLTIATATWAHLVGVGAVLAFVVLGFIAAIPPLITD